MTALPSWIDDAEREAEASSGPVCIRRQRVLALLAVVRAAQDLRKLPRQLWTRQAFDAALSALADR